MGCKQGQEAVEDHLQELQVGEHRLGTTVRGLSDTDIAQRWLTRMRSAQEFGVTQPFLLQQAAWLYERHFQHVKAQMTKLRTSNAPTPVLGSTSQQTVAGGVPMKRLGSGGGGASRAPSSLSIRSRDSPVARTDVVGGTGTPSMRPELSRTPSAATVTQSRPFLPPSSPRQPVQRSFRSTATSRRTETTPLPAATDSPTTAAAASPPASESTSTSSSSADEDSDAPPARQSQLFRRPPPFQRHKKTKTALADVDDTGEDSGDDSPTFLPFAAAKGGDGTQQPREDISATLRDNAATPPRTTRTHPSNIVAVQTARANTSATARGKGKQPVHTGKLESSASSVSSTAATPGATAPSEAAQQHRRQLDALSPRHRAELARLSPRRQGTARDGSDGTPSMGSSFSDLDGKTFSSYLIILLVVRDHGM